MEEEYNILAMRIQGSTMFMDMQHKIGHVVVKDLNDFELEELEEELGEFKSKINGVMDTLNSLL